MLVLRHLEVALQVPLVVLDLALLLDLLSRLDLSRLVQPVLLLQHPVSVYVTLEEVRNPPPILLQSKVGPPQVSHSVCDF